MTDRITDINETGAMEVCDRRGEGGVVWRGVEEEGDDVSARGPICATEIQNRITSCSVQPSSFARILYFKNVTLNVTGKKP